jgi:hypothetical protein
MKKCIALFLGGIIISLHAFAQLSLNGLHFTGGSQEAVVVANYPNTIDTGSFTIEAWIRDDVVITPGIPTEEPILDNRENSTGPDFGFRLCINNGDIVLFAGLTGFGVSSGFDLRDGVCHHIAVTRSAGMIRSYIDGQLNATTNSFASLYSSAPALIIGAKEQLPGSGTYWSFNGLIKEIRIWNIARSQAQIQANLDTIVSPSVNLISYWRCNEGSGSNVQDYAAGFNGVSSAGWTTGCPGCVLPPASIVANGPTTFCSPGAVQLNATAGVGVSYQWKKNGTNISGATSATYLAAASGSYTVTVSNSCGPSLSSPVNVTVNPLPGAAITPIGPTTFCSGGSVQLSAPAGANKSYQWKKNGNNIPGAIQSSYTATTSGSYKVIVTNTITGCTKATSNATVVTVNALPNATITPGGPTTFCAGDSVILSGNSGTNLTYQWKRNNTTIAGATARKYTAKIAGSYKVKVTNVNGCTKLSAAQTVSVPCRESEITPTANHFDVQVYPNPSSGDFTIETFNTVSEKTIVEIYDAIGKNVLSGIYYDSFFNVPDASLVPGVYSAVITNGENRKMVKVIKSN